MKKLMLFVLIVSSIHAGEIKDTYHKINQIDDMTTRIEMKLDLVIDQYIKDEEAAENRSKAVDNTIQQTKDGIKKGASWLSDKTKEVLDQ